MQPILLRMVFYLGLCLAAQTVLFNMWDSKKAFTVLSASLIPSISMGQSTSNVSLQWFAPNKSAVNDLSTVLRAEGVYGFIFNSSTTPSAAPYSTYNWCNMPHVRSQEYVKASAEYNLKYVEVIHRHHKRTPYASNTFPHETYSWNCDDEGLFYYGSPQPENNAAAISWQVYTSPINPIAPQGFNGSCQFPQISAGGLLDSRQHGQDLFGVYHDLLHFLPDQLDTTKLSFRVTNNQITSQVAGQVIYAMYPNTDHQTTRVLVQPSSVDSLEPTYSCPAATALYSKYGVGSSNAAWQQHLKANQTVDLFSQLDAISGISPTNPDWHNWFDHYFDNLSARLCHDKPLPCSANNSALCVTLDEADAVFRRGEYEYSFIYRDTAELFNASVASYGIWMAELAANLRNVMGGNDTIIYRHNFAHDGSMSRLLSFLQVNNMIWPGMGSEVVFELYSKAETYYLRVLWGGQVLTSSNPSLGTMDMLPVETLLAYIDGLVGVGASKVLGLCSSSSS